MFKRWFQTEEGNSREKEPVKFALCATVALLYYELYHDLHQKFIKGELVRLIRLLKLPKQIDETIIFFQQGHGYESLQGFFDIIRQEESTDIISTCLHWAVNGESGYDARSRAVLCRLAIRLDVKLVEFESNFATDLKEELERNQNEILEANNSNKEKSKEQKAKSRRRIAIISAATVAGAGLCAFTAGLAAPLVAAGVGSLIGGAGTVIGSATGIAIITSIFGAAGGGLAGYKMKRRIGGLEEFRFVPIRMGDSLHLAIAVSGWTGGDNLGFTVPWKRLDMSTEQVSLVWESKYLRELGTAMDRLIGSAVVAGVGEVLKLTALSGLLAGLALPAAVLSATNLVDNPWSVCTKRAKQAGEELASILIKGVQGKRPVSLIGCSSGALVIWSCLKALSKEGDSALGIVSDTIILGAPITTNVDEWEAIRKVVSGRLINGWTESDWVLGLLCHDNVAGTQRINWRQIEDKRLVNVRLTGTISGHTDYQAKMSKILRLIDACQEEYKINRYYNDGSSISKSTSCSTLSNLHNLERSRSLSALPKAKIRSSKLRKTKSLNNLFFPL